MAKPNYKIKWTYGRDPNPKTWHQTVEALNSLRAFHAHEKIPQLSSRLETVDKRLHSFKEKGGKDDF